MRFALVDFIIDVHRVERVPSPRECCIHTARFVALRRNDTLKMWRGLTSFILKCNEWIRFGKVMSDRLRTCPRCGEIWFFASTGDYGSGYENKGYRVNCRCGYAWEKFGHWCKTKEEVIEEWNNENRD